MANSLKFGNGKWATNTNTVLAYNDENENFKPLPFTFSRASSATVVNKNGLIETVASGEPRIDFSNDVKGALLLEPSRSNVITDSEDISTWTNSGSLTRTYNIAVAPNGQTTADGIQDETGGTFKYVYKQVSVSANSTYSGSIFVKKVASETNYTGLILAFYGGTTKYAYGIINSVTGTIVSADSTITPTFKVDDYGNYWRFSITATDNGSNTLCRFGVYACLSTNGTTLSTGVSSIRTIWGAQLEAGSYATSLINTSGSAVTRIADVCSQTLPDVVIGQTEGSAYFEYTGNGSDNSGQRIFVLRGSSTADRIAVFDQSGKIRIYVSDGGGLQLDTTTNVDTVSTHKVAFRYKLNDFKLYIDGTAIVTDSTFTVPTLNSVYVGTSEGFGGTLGGNVSDVKLYDTALSDSELQALTTL